MSSRRSICLLLCAASATAGAREVRLQSANGNEGQCPETVAQVRQAGPGVRTSRQKARTPPSVRTGDSEPALRQQTPRWHSYLPGMFR